MQSCLLLGAALLAACSERNAPTSPLARPLAATAALLDRPYTWAVKCQDKKSAKDLSMDYSFAWTEKTRVISGTGKRYGHPRSAGPLTRVGGRPGTPQGFTPGG